MMATNFEQEAALQNDNAAVEDERQLVHHPLRGYRVLSTLGDGAYGHVVKALELATGHHVAIKLGMFGDLEKEFSREFEMLTTLKHENIVQVYRFGSNPLMIVMEWMPSGSLRTLQSETQFRLHEEVLRKYMLDALRGLAYLHSKGVLHRDIKPGNMLLKDGVLKLSDFGTSVAGAHATRTASRAVVGTPVYMAPESIKGRHSQASDIWALACTAVELASVEPLWSELGPVAREPLPLMFRIGNAEPPNHHPKIPEYLSGQLQGILESCFDADYTKRPSAAGLVGDPYFTAPALPADVETTSAYAASAALTALPVPESKHLQQYSSDHMISSEGSRQVTQTAGSLQDALHSAPYPPTEPHHQQQEQREPTPPPSVTVVEQHRQQQQRALMFLEVYKKKREPVRHAARKH